jgi:hypothetical protein
MIMDSYDIAKSILNLYQENVDKSSGEMNKDKLIVPLFFDSIEDGKMFEIEDVFFVEGYGIILR